MSTVALTIPELPALRIRNHAGRSRNDRLPGAIHYQHPDQHWLILSDLGDPDDSVVEVRMLPDETARECADRLAEYGRAK